MLDREWQQRIDTYIQTVPHKACQPLGCYYMNHFQQKRLYQRMPNRLLHR